MVQTAYCVLQSLRGFDLICNQGKSDTRGDEGKGRRYIYRSLSCLVLTSKTDNQTKETEQVIEKRYRGPEDETTKFACDSSGPSWTQTSVGDADGTRLSQKVRGTSQE